MLELRHPGCAVKAGGPYPYGLSDGPFDGVERTVASSYNIASMGSALMGICAAPSVTALIPSDWVFLAAASASRIYRAKSYDGAHGKLSS